MSFKERFEKSMQEQAQRAKEFSEAQAAYRAREDEPLRIRENAKARLQSSRGYQEIANSLNDPELLEAFDLISQQTGLDLNPEEMVEAILKEVNSQIDTFPFSLLMISDQDKASIRDDLMNIKEMALVETALERGGSFSRIRSTSALSDESFVLGVCFRNGKLTYSVNRNEFTPLNDVLDHLADALAGRYPLLMSYEYPRDPN